MSDKKILLMLYPGCISFETMLAVEILGRSYSVDAVTTNNQNHMDASGLQIVPQLPFEEVNTADYVALLVPGGNPDEIVGKTHVQKLIREFHTADLIIGGICAGVLVLADSGILKGQTITHNYTEKFAPIEVVNFTKQFWADVNYKESLCITSGNIVTAMPNGYVEFAVELALKLNVIPPDKAAKMVQYYKGAL